MTTSQRQSVQRTLVVTCGQVAGTTGEQLHQLLAQPGEPREAIQIVSILPEDDQAGRKALLEGVRHISQTSVRASLIQDNWQLDRSGELAVIFVLDMGAAANPAWPGTAVMEIAGLVRSELGIETAALLLLLAPEGEARPTPMCLNKILKHSQAFTRGTILMGLVNEAGLRLADNDELAHAVAHLLHVLLITPLRDAPDWLIERLGWQPERSGIASSAGLTTWQWRPQREQERLARLWSLSALTQWQQPRSEQAGEIANSALTWLDQQGCAPSQLGEEASRLVTPFSVPAWTYPQLWQVRLQTEKLKRLTAMFPETVADTVQHVEEALSPALEKREAALLAACRRQLEEMPLAGPARCQRFLHAVEREIESYLDDVAARQDAEDERSHSLQALYGQFEQHMANLLDQWPQAHWRAWLKASLQPWRWPGLVWQYWQMQTTGQQMAHLVQQMAQLEQQQVLTAVLFSAYDELGSAVRRVQQHVEEVSDVLAYVQRQLVEDKDDSAPYSLYQQLVAAPALEAAEAAAAIGGLGEQLVEPDDTALADNLLAAGRERFQLVLEWTAVDALAHLFPTEAELAAWWQERWQAADPLWRYDDAQLAEGSQGRQSSLVVIGAAGVQSFKEQVNLGETTDVRCLEMVDRQQIILLRFRAGLNLCDD